MIDLVFTPFAIAMAAIPIALAVLAWLVVRSQRQHKILSRGWWLKREESWRERRAVHIKNKNYDGAAFCLWQANCCRDKADGRCLTQTT